jgi:CheY-like chemotaxis protein
VEVLVLGDLAVHVRGGNLEPALTRSLAETLVILAVYGRPVKTAELRNALDWHPNDGSLQQYISKIKKQGLPIVSSGSRGHMEYALDMGHCRVDAQEFIRGVGEGRPIDGLLALWRSAVEPAVLKTMPWAAVKRARAELIQRIAALAEPEQTALTELARFADLFLGDKDVDQIRPYGPGSRPRLLLVEDEPEMMKEIRSRLEPYYRITPITTLDDWWDFLRQPENLERIDGALVDLHLTSSLNDKRGIEIVKHLRDHTGIPAALFTANGMERSGYQHQRRMAEFRLVDIVDKKNDDWWEALETASRLLTGTGVPERRHRLETWLETAYLKLKRETEGAPPGSVAAGRRRRCDDDYGQVLPLVRVGDIEVAEREVDRFCKSWPTSP